MLGREELTAYDCNEGSYDSMGFPWQYKEMVYDKDKADSVMDAMEARIKELEEAISKMEASIPKWISVKDRLPYSMERVLVCTTRGTFAPATYSPLTNSWIEHGQLLGKITHWMPLPQPPTTKEK